jgi:hypothetical protein
MKQAALKAVKIVSNLGNTAAKEIGKELASQVYDNTTSKLTEKTNTLSPPPSTIKP